MGLSYYRHAKDTDVHLTIPLSPQKFICLITLSKAIASLVDLNSIFFFDLVLSTVGVGHLPVEFLGMFVFYPLRFENVLTCILYSRA